MPYIIDITCEALPSRASFTVPSPTYHGLGWSLIATIKAHLAIRRTMRRLYEAEVASAHLCNRLRSDIGLPPLPDGSTRHWEIRT